MLLAHHDHPDTYQHLLTHPVWEEVFAWLKTMPADLAPGEHEIRGREVYVNHFTTDTTTRTETVYEAHKNYIDFHYCLEGGELIEWAPVPTLKAKNEYDAEKDYTLFESPAIATTLRMTPKSFAIFFPSEAHMPKINDGTNQSVHKLVFKIKLNLLH